MNKIANTADDWSAQCADGRAAAEEALCHARETANPTKLVRAIQAMEGAQEPTGYKVGWATHLALAAMRAA